MARFSFSWDKGVGLFLIIAVVLGSLLSDNFANASNLSFVLRDVTEFAIIALAMTFLIISGEIDLSVASTLNLSSASLGFLYRAGAPFEVAIVGGLLVGLACGLFNGWLVTKLGLPSLAVTIATLALYRGLSYALLGNQPVNQLPEFWISIGYGRIPGTFLPWSTILLVLLAALAWFILHNTRYGRWTFAIGVNQEAARFSGIPVERTKLMLFAMTGLMSGVAGVVYTLRFASSSPDGAVGYELSVIAAVLFGGVSIAGGIGTMWGVLAAVLSLGVIRSALQLAGFTANSLLIVSGGLLLISVVAPKITEGLRSRAFVRSKVNTNKTIREVGNE
ncbi:ABC transporter permease [Pontimonas sp.]|nr:ABC transporter permease [Pontimonas sp.]